MRRLLFESLLKRPLTEPSPGPDDRALARTYAATPDPKWVVAVGDCARDGGIFASSYAVVGGSTGWCRSTCTSAAAR